MISMQELKYTGNSNCLKTDTRERADQFRHKKKSYIVYPRTKHPIILFLSE